MKSYGKRIEGIISELESEVSQHLTEATGLVDSVAQFSISVASSVGLGDEARQIKGEIDCNINFLISKAILKDVDKLSPADLTPENIKRQQEILK